MLIDAKVEQSTLPHSNRPLIIDLYSILRQVKSLLVLFIFIKLFTMLVYSLYNLNNII